MMEYQQYEYSSEISEIKVTEINADKSEAVSVEAKISGRRMATEDIENKKLAAEEVQNKWLVAEEVRNLAVENKTNSNHKKISKSIPIITTYNINVEIMTENLKAILGHNEFHLWVLCKTVTNIVVCTLEDYERT